MDEIEVARLRRSFRAIRDGYSLANIGGEKIYVKHLSSLERGDIDMEHVAFFDAAVSKGLASEKTRLEQLRDDKIWSAEDEKKIEDQRNYIKNLTDTKSNVLPWHLEEINKQLEAANKLLAGKLTMRSSVIGLTAESFASRKLNELYICYSLFRDKNFEEPMVSRESIDEYDDEELSLLVRAYNKAMLEVSEGFIKKIAIARFFQDLYSLCEKTHIVSSGRLLLI